MQNRTKRVALFAAFGLMATFFAERDAGATLRWSASGAHCTPWGSGYGYNKTFGQLVLPIQQSNTWAICEIPMGTDLVELATASARTFSTVNLRIKNVSPGTRTIDTNLAITDYDSDSVCGCDLVSNSVGSNVFLNRTLNIAALGASCGGCAGGDFGNWIPIVSIVMTGSSGDGMVVKRLQVFDDT